MLPTRTGRLEEPTVYFQDGIRKIDAIVVYNTSKKTSEITNFINHLIQVKLQVEEENSMNNEDKTFIKIHAPDDILQKFAIKYDVSAQFKQITRIPDPLVPLKFMKTILNDPNPDMSNSIVIRGWDTLSKLPPKTFTTAERSTVVFTMLNYVKYGTDDFKIGINQMLHDKMFLDAFPLHDGKWKWPDSHEGLINDRQLLTRYWGTFKMWNKQQPLNAIEKYLGHEIGLYFAWLGYYNWMLMLASIMGFVTFVFGLLTALVFVPKPIIEACSLNLTLCPNCKSCYTKQLMDYCTYFRYADVNDNFSSVLFACAMSFWATFFMEFWKREKAILMTRWNINSTEDLTCRPDFVIKANNVRYHKYTNELELFMPATTQILHYTISVFVVASMVIMVLFVIFCIILYERWLKILSVEKIYISFTSAVMTVSVMIILRKIYGVMAIWLTTQETPRTQLDFDKSYMVKMICFSLINSYGKLIYIAFIKGKYFTYPGDPKMRNSNFPLIDEVCDPTGCVSEVSMLLAIVTVLKPIFENCVEMLIPRLKIICRRLKKKKDEFQHQADSLPIWELDYDLNPTNHFFIMGEIEEMVLQYGFVTLLVPAFPLAPVAALINNIFEIRIDSSKIMKYYRRPKVNRSSSINMWFDTLQAMTYLAVLTNGLFIAFTSNFIPKTFYYFNENKDLKGFPKYVLSQFKVVDDYWNNANITECWYVGQRYPPDHEKPYQHKYIYFCIMTWRLTFTILFTVTVMLATSIIAYIIPDIPRGIRDLIAYNEKKVRDRDV